jgi:thioredoxin-like negative regulator of GroEL
VFVKVDVDECTETADTIGQVKCMPTFKVLSDGKEIDSVLGAREADLQAMIKKHCS